MLDRQFTCVDCKALSPESGEETQLISTKYGWRIVRRVGENGETYVDARCAACWAKFRAAMAVPGLGRSGHG